MKPTGLVSGNSIRNKLGNETCEIAHVRKDWSLGMDLAMYNSNPAEGQFDWTAWDAVFAKAKANGVRLLVRPTTDTHTHNWQLTVPKWISSNNELYIAGSNADGSKNTRVPKYSHERVFQNKKAFLQAFHDRYAHLYEFWKIDASRGGFSGEGHTASHGYNNAQFGMDNRNVTYRYVMAHIDIFGAENCVGFANDDVEGIARHLAMGFTYFRRDGIGAPYQMNQLVSWLVNVPGFAGALDDGGFIAEPWNRLQVWPGDPDVQQDFMLTANQLVSLNCILFFNMDNEIPQQFIDNGFWPKLQAHFATVNNPGGDGGGDGGTEPTDPELEARVTQLEEDMQSLSQEVEELARLLENAYIKVVFK